MPSPQIWNDNLQKINNALTNEWQSCKEIGDKVEMSAKMVGYLIISLVNRNLVECKYKNTNYQIKPFYRKKS